MNPGFVARQESYDRLLEKVSRGGILSPSEMTSMERFEDELGRANGGLAGIPDQLSLDQAMAYTGYKQRTIYTAVEAGDLARLSDGRFERGALDTWLIVKKRQPRPEALLAPVDDEETEGSGEERINGRFEEAKYRKHRARREELMVGQMEGNLIQRELVEQDRVTRALEMKSGLLLLSRRVAHKIAALAGVEMEPVKTIVDEECEQLLKSFCRKVIINAD